MNERIRKFELQCFVYSEQTNKNIFDREKFAKLIIENCIGEVIKLRKQYDTHKDVESKYNDYYVDAFLQVENKLKQYLE